jgi:hypothetical protein
LGVALSILWLASYVGGGAVVLARFAAADPDHAPPYMPPVVFLWVVGFFAGRAGIERLYLAVSAWASRKNVMGRLGKWLRLLPLRIDRFTGWLPFQPKAGKVQFANVAEREAVADNTGWAPPPWLGSELRTDQAILFDKPAITWLEVDAKRIAGEPAVCGNILSQTVSEIIRCDLLDAAAEDRPGSERAKWGDIRRQADDNYLLLRSRSAEGWNVPERGSRARRLASLETTYA